MSARGLSNSERINLEKAHILLLDSSAHGLEIMVQIMTGFGMRNFYRCQKVEEAQTIVRAKPVDLFIVDPNGADADGYEFLKWLRRSGIEPNCHAPIILVSGHAQISNVRKARDTGANFFMVKPLTAGALLERVLWLARDKRPFVELDHYVGPDRRFKMPGPPAGSDGRRKNDLPLDIGDASEPNMSQFEIDGLLKPQKAAL